MRGGAQHLNIGSDLGCVSGGGLGWAFRGLSNFRGRKVKGWNNTGPSLTASLVKNNKSTIRRKKKSPRGRWPLQKKKEGSLTTIDSIKP